MRSIIKMLRLAFLATLAFLAIGAIGAGSASALLFLTLLNLELILILSHKLALLLTLSGSRFDCKLILGHGLVLNKTDVIDKILLTFHECAAVIGGSSGSCKSSQAGEKEGLITTLDLDALLITTLTGLYALVLLAEKGPSTNLAEFTCFGGLQKEIWTGEIAGELPAKIELEKGLAESTIEFATKTGETGMPEITSWWTLGGTGGPSPKFEATLSGLVNEKTEASWDLTMTILSESHHLFKVCHN
jgi:hypothetical protein